MLRSFQFVVIISLLSCQFALAKDCVILLHGLLRSPSAMQSLQTALETRYQVVNQGYPSRSATIEQLSEPTIDQALERCGLEVKVHFVTHSLGGILVRHYLERRSIKTLGRVVMLGPPNQGSDVVDYFRHVPGYTLLNGPAGLQLGKDDNSVPLKLGPVEFELGVIAGSQSWNLILSQFLENPDDGKVSVEDTKVQGMKAHVVLPVTHTFMVSDDQVIDQVRYFLRFGMFEPFE